MKQDWLPIDTRARIGLTGSSDCRIPGLPSPVGEVGAGGEGVGVFGSRDAFADGQEGGELVAGGCPIPSLPGVVGEVGACGEGFGVFGSQDAFADEQEGGELV